MGNAINWPPTQAGFGSVPGVCLGTTFHQLAQGLSDYLPYIPCSALGSVPCRPHLSSLPHECLDTVMFPKAGDGMHPQWGMGTPHALVVLHLCHLSAGARRDLRVHFDSWAYCSRTVSQTGSPLELGQKRMPHATPRAADLSGK